MTIEEFNAYEKSELKRMTKEYERMRNKYEEMYNTYHRWWKENIVFSLLIVAFFTFAGAIVWSTYVKIAPCPHCPHCKEAIRKACAAMYIEAPEISNDTMVKINNQHSRHALHALSLWSPSRSSMSFFQSSMSCSCSSILRSSTAIRSSWRFCVLPSFGMPQSFMPSPSAVSRTHFTQKEVPYDPRR